MLTLRPCLLLCLAACGPTSPMTTATGGSTDGSTGDPAGSTSTSTTGATSPTTTGPTTGATTSTSMAPPDLGALFIMEQDGGVIEDCDIWGQDCPRGEKCSPHSTDGNGSWNSLKCVPIVRDPDHAGEPCTVEGGPSTGVDSCDLESMCWNVDKDTLMGVCVPFCDGTPDAPICPDGTHCLVANDGVLTLCLPDCDPLLQDCPGTDLCVPNPQDPNSFVCVIDASKEEGQVFDPCEYANACDKGLMCADAALASECDPMAAGCCLPFCDTTAPDCPGMMQECLPWFEMNQAPPGFENVGLCGIPQ